MHCNSAAVTVAVVAVRKSVAAVVVVAVVVAFALAAAVAHSRVAVVVVLHSTVGNMPPVVAGGADTVYEDSSGVAYKPKYK